MKKGKLEVVYEEIVIKREKAWLFKFKDYPNRVWIPVKMFWFEPTKNIIRMNEDFGYKKLLDASKLPEGKRLLKINTDAIIEERDTSIVLKGRLIDDGIIKGESIIYIPKKLYIDGCVPEWILWKKIADFIKRVDFRCFVLFQSGKNFHIGNILDGGKTISSTNAINSFRYGR